MDFGEIGTAALYGAIGGGVGALIATVLAAPFAKSRHGKAIATFLTVAGVAVGINVAEPVLSPYLGKYVGDSETARAGKAEAEIDTALAELRADPLVAAIFEREPSLEATLRSDLQEIAREAKSAGEGRRQAFGVGYQAVSTRLTRYVARGQGEDIVAFFDLNIEVLGHLAASDPEFCHAYLYRPTTLAGMGVGEVSARIGAERYARQQTAAARVVKGAFDAVPDYDAATAQLVVNQGGKLLFDLLGEEKIGLVTEGRKPETAEEARAACEASVAMLSLLRASHPPADALRHLMVLSDTDA